MRTEHFDIYFYPSEREGVDIAARLAERWYARLSRQLNHTLSERQPLMLYASHADFEQTNVVSEEINEGTGGFTEPIRRRIVLPLSGPIADTDHVIGHELVHAFQFDMSGPLVGDRQQTPLDRLPLWFVEGMAEYLSLGRIDGNAAMKLRDAANRDELPSILDLRKPKYFPYQWGHAVFAYIAGRYGEQIDSTPVSLGGFDRQRGGVDPDDARHQRAGSVEGVARGDSRALRTGAHGSHAAAQPRPAGYPRSIRFGTQRRAGTQP